MTQVGNHEGKRLKVGLRGGCYHIYVYIRDRWSLRWGFAKLGVLGVTMNQDFHVGLIWKYPSVPERVTRPVKELLYGMKCRV